MIELIENECARFGVPGAAVSVVAGGQTVFADGFGRRDETEPVTASTLFMLASDTKCFAAATLCLLVEDGLLDLDEPVRTYLPWFAMHDERVSDLVTCRDLLAHRTGLPRHELMTVGNGDFRITNEEVARRMRHLEASRPFRQGFGYNNVHYATAGHVAEVLTGQPWKDLLAERILDPLGMATTSTYRPALTDGDFAAPHSGNTRLPFQTREYDLPNGGVVTNADDLGRWLRARLGHGGLSAEVLEMLHEPSVATEQPLPFPELHSLGYGLGNMVCTYRGHRLQLHGGSQIGFASQVLVLPDADVGVAVLTNLHGTSLPLALGLSLVDQVLGLDPIPWGERLSANSQAPTLAGVRPGRPARAPLEYAGTFHHPAYGDLSLAVHDGALRASFHGLDDELLLTHIDLDEWLLGFASVPEFTVPVSVQHGPDRQAIGVALRLDAELEPLVFERR